MRILYVTHKPFYPLTGGDCIRMSQMLDELLLQGDVDVMYLVHKCEGESMKSYNPAIGEEFPIAAGWWRRLLKAGSTFFNRKPLLINIYRHGAMSRRLRELASGYDVVVLGSLGTADYCAELCARGIDVRIDLTDSPAMNLDNEAALTSGLKRWWIKLNARRMRRLEKMWRSIAKSVAFISEVDRDYLHVQGAREVIVSNSVALPPEDMTSRCDNPDELLFVGNMGYAPNVAAVKRFVANVLPLIASHRTGATFRIVGTRVGEEIKALARDNGHVVVEGYVEDLQRCYRSAGIFVAPMYSGSGIQNKILQALAAGCCVVTTPIGAEGLDCQADGFVVADSDEAMAQSIITLAADADARRGYGLRGREYVARSFSRDRVSQQVREFLSRR